MDNHAIGGEQVGTGHVHQSNEDASTFDRILHSFVDMAHQRRDNSNQAYMMLSGKSYADIYALLSNRICERYQQAFSVADVSQHIKQWARCYMEVDVSPSRQCRIMDFSRDPVDGKPAVLILEAFIKNRLPDIVL